MECHCYRDDYELILHLVVAGFASKVVDKVAMLLVSVTHGFSQVFENHELGRNRLKRFPKHHANLGTRLKPGVN